MIDVIEPNSAIPGKGMAARVRHAMDLTGIARMYCSERRGYFVRVGIRRNRKIYRKDFWESRCGGEQNALKLAQAWRDMIILKHRPMSIMEFCSIVRVNNTSGVPGVSRNVKQHCARNGSVSARAYWQARVPSVDGNYRICSFSVLVYGEEAAKQHAIDARLQGLRTLGNIAFKANALPLPVSTREDIAVMVAKLRHPKDERQRRAAERKAKRLQDEERARAKLAAAQAAEKVALAATTNRTGEPYIGRFATAEGTSFSWRVSMIRQGIVYRKTFSDSVYDGAEGALIAAKAWRDDLFRALPIESKANVVTRVNSTNTSGVTGVTRTSQISKGKECHYWVGYGSKIKGLPRRSKKFSIAKYGEEQAFGLAVQARASFVEEMVEVESLHHRAARQLMRTLRLG